MATQHYVDKNFRPDSLALIDYMNKVIEEYVAQGFVLTVRQLYYQLVARAVIPNTERSYKRITGLVNDAKLAGMMDWDAIEDRTREFIKQNRFESGASILRAAAQQFHMDMWTDQPMRVFCIVEKEALAGVLEGVCKEWDIPLLAARGYPSGTVLREFAQQQIRPALRAGQEIYILHLGDHDPSGIDMSRDLLDRISLFSNHYVEFNRLALNMEQIEEQQPPENPAKSSDSRFEDYFQKFGESSWELDALSPAYLAELVSDRVAELVDTDNWEARRAEIQEVKDSLIEFGSTFDEQ